MNRPVAAFVLCIILLLRAASACAASPPSDLTEAQLIDYLRTASPRATAISSATDIASAEVLQARRLPNPEIAYSDNSTASGSDTIGGNVHSVNVAVALPIFGQRRSRIDAALAKQAATSAEVAGSRLELERAGRRAFAELLAAQDRVAAWDDTVADTEKVETIVVGRAAAGKKSQYDVERIRLQLASDRRERSEAIAAREAAAGVVAALVGIPGWRPHASGELRLRGIDTDVGKLWEHARTSLPELKSATLGYRADVAAIEVARREGWPVPQITIGEQSTTDPHGVAVTAGISIPLPVFDRNQGEIARSAATARASALELEAATREAQARLETAVAVLVSRRDALAAFERDAMSHVPTLKEMAKAFYDSGEGNIVDLLDALKAIAETRLGHIELVAAVVPAELDVEFSAGIDVQGG